MVFSLTLFLNFTTLKKYFLNDLDSDSIFSVLNVFKSHPSIKNMKVKSLIRHFLLTTLNTDVVMKVINKLHVAKTCQVNDLPTKVIIQKFMRNYYMTSYLNTLTVYKPLISADFEKFSVPSTVY